MMAQISADDAWYRLRRTLDDLAVGDRRVVDAETVIGVVVQIETAAELRRLADRLCTADALVILRRAEELDAEGVRRG